MEALSGIRELTPIQEFYAGRNVFITGATGFMGKLVIDKLLRCCSGVGTLYLLVRPKEGKDVHDRILELFQEPVFSKLRREYPTFMQHIVGISGDCSVPDLGLSTEDRLVLEQNVSIVFHAAADVKFNIPIKMAVMVNVEGTKAVLDLCKRMTNLKAGIHISTAYANCVRRYIDEKFYDPPIEAEKLIRLTNNMSDDLAGYVTNKLLGKWPNIYTFTKAVTENVIAMDACALPFGVFRPSIVTATCKEPIKGWIGTSHGPTTFLSLFSMGILRVAHSDGSVHEDIVPADMTVNALIASAWDVANLKKTSMKDAVPIYNFVSHNPMTIKYIVDSSRAELENTPMNNAIWYYFVILVKNRAVFAFLHILLHLVPGLLVDCARVLMRKEPKMVKLYNYINKRLALLSHFLIREWTFSSQRVNELVNKMDERDSEIFYCDIKDVDWTLYMSLYTRGIREFICNDPMESVPEAQIKWRRLYWAHQLVKAVILVTLGTLLWFTISTTINFSGLVFYLPVRQLPVYFPVDRTSKI